MDEYEELDSFTEKMIRRNEMRRKLLNDSNIISSDLSDSAEDLSPDQSCESQTSIESNIKVLRNSSQTNIKPIESPVIAKVEPPVDAKTKQVIENLQKLSPTRKRVPLSQRLNSIAQRLDDSENFEFIDSNSTDEPKQRTQSPVKTIKPVVQQTDSPPKKKLLLNERLNQLARNYDDPSDVDLRPRPPASPKSVQSPGKSWRRPEPVFAQRIESPKLLFSESPKRVTNEWPKQVSSESPKWAFNESPKKVIDEWPKRVTNESPKRVTTNSPKRLNLSPIESMEPKAVESIPQEKAPSVERKIFEVKRKSPHQRPENFEPVKTKIVISNKISKMKEMFEKKLAYETNTASMCKKDVERRREEMIEALTTSSPTTTSGQLTPNCSPPKKRLLLNEGVDETHPQEKQTSDNQLKDCSDDDNEVKANDFREPIDDDMAHQTVCEAFQEIEDMTEPLDEELTGNMNFEIDSRLTESKSTVEKNLNIESPTKNRLYPVLDLEDDQFCYNEPNPPAKPPRTLFAEEKASEKPSTPMRTISFYRKEKQSQSQSTTPTVVLAVPKITQNPKEINYEERNRKIKEEIMKLKREVEDTNRVAGQASHALNICLERNEFKGSAERVEAEKLLLLAGVKRITFAREITRLQDMMNQRKPPTDTTLGTLVLRDLKLKIRYDFKVNQMKGNKTHHLLCIVNNGPKVYVTNIVNTNSLSNDSMADTFAEFQFGTTLTELSSDFKVYIDVYSLTTYDKELPHELKYHIKKTPKKNKNTMKSPSVRSPGGPGAVLSTSFRLIGKVCITLANYHKKFFKLDNFDSKSPLEGGLEARAELSVSHHYHRDGFFDVRDASGCYNMRWVVLKGHHIAIYRFPEDTETKAPMFKIDLKHVINPSIELVPSHLRHTARNNSIAMIIVDPRHDSKNIFTKGGSLPRNPPKKFVMSSESRENCLQWAKELNKALANIRVWSGDAVKPYNKEEFERLLFSLD